MSYAMAVSLNMSFDDNVKTSDSCKKTAEK